ncbi:hypothetical protein FQR65_LT18509 [Abscondita terminalis]|nr:hypothetical protein FQR65_LT18509 [Abscondita terminalis]
MFATDYVVFFVMLAISVFIGIYFSLIKNQPKTTGDELSFGWKINGFAIPVTLSLIASCVSGITLLAVLRRLLTWNKLYLLSIFITNFLYFVLLALSASNLKTRRINVNLIACITSIMCVFYTTIGGFKAVVWTDVVQFVGMVISMLTVLYLGITSIGDFKTVWSQAREADRLNWDFSVDPTIKDGFWPIIFGGSVLWMYYGGLHPASVQKYLSICNRKKTRWICGTFAIGVGSFIAASVIIGFILHAKYRGCDPLSSSQIKSADQLLPYFIAEISDNVPGVKGTFVVGLFSAVLSTLSSSFNSFGTTIYGDFVVPYLSSPLSEKSSNCLIKLIIVVSGILCIGLTFIVDKLGSILTFINAIQCSLSGLIVGLFSLGILFSSSNSKGALWGAAVSFLISTWVAAGHEWYKMQGAFNSFVKPLSVDNCTFQFNLTLIAPTIGVSKPFLLYRLSYWFNAVISMSLLIIVGLIVSSCTKPDKTMVDQKLLNPVFYRLFKKMTRNRDVDGGNQNLEMTTYTFNNNSKN